MFFSATKCGVPCWQCAAIAKNPLTLLSEYSCLKKHEIFFFLGAIRPIGSGPTGYTESADPIDSGSNLDPNNVSDLKKTNGMGDTTWLSCGLICAARDPSKENVTRRRQSRNLCIFTIRYLLIIDLFSHSVASSHRPQTCIQYVV